MKKIIFVVMTLFAGQSFAQEAFYGSLKLGMGDLSGEGTSELDTELTYGVNAGVLFNDNVSIGINLNFYSTKYELGGNSAKYSVMPILADVTFYTSNPTDTNTFYIGGLLGITRSKSQVTSLGTNSESDTSFGGKVGYMFQLAPDFSLSPEFNIVRVMGNTDYNIMNGQLVLTGWF